MKNWYYSSVRISSLLGWRLQRREVKKLVFLLGGKLRNSSIEYYHLQNREPLLTNKCNCPNQYETAKQDIQSMILSYTPQKVAMLNMSNPSCVNVQQSYNQSDTNHCAAFKSLVLFHKTRILYICINLRAHFIFFELIPNYFCSCYKVMNRTSIFTHTDHKSTHNNSDTQS
ncbi:hypothetical protein QF049_001297 [Paenibacillus sp. W4I10]|nr:hypothetical protein [Paenibacillus sp. W4I10]